MREKENGKLAHTSHTCNCPLNTNTNNGVFVLLRSWWRRIYALLGVIRSLPWWTFRLHIPVRASLLITSCVLYPGTLISTNCKCTQPCWRCISQTHCHSALSKHEMCWGNVFEMRSCVLKGKRIVCQTFAAEHAVLFLGEWSHGVKHECVCDANSKYSPLKSLKHS